MLTYMLENNARIPLYEQLYLAIRQDIVDGVLQSHTKLPSKRQLAAHLEISVATVEAAYGQLVAEGYLLAAVKRGYFVQSVSVPQQPVKQERAVVQTAEEPCCTYDLRTSAVDTDGFPFATWAKLMRATLSDYGGMLLQSTSPQGALALREEIQRYLYSFRGISVSIEQIVVGAGSEYLIGLLIQLLGRDKVYALENPGYPKVAQTFRAGGAQVVPIPLDGEGMREDAMRQAAPDVVYLTPSHHFPLGMVMPVARRMAMLHWAAAEEQRYLIEDDYDSEFRYTSRPIATLKTLDHADRVIYLNTFAKSLAPSLRIGYMVLPMPLVQQLQERLGFYSSTVPSFEQYTLAKFMQTGAFERHISRSRNRYRLRRDALLAAIAASPLAKVAEVHGGDAGQHILVQVCNGMDEQTLVTAAAAVGVCLTGLSRYFLHAEEQVTPATVLMGYAGMVAEQLQEAVACLERAWLS